MTGDRGFLRQIGTGRVFPADRAGELRKRPDMQACDKTGKLIEAPAASGPAVDDPRAKALATARATVDGMTSEQLDAFTSAQKIKVPKEIEKLEDAKAHVKDVMRKRHDKAE